MDHNVSFLGLLWFPRQASDDDLRQEPFRELMAELPAGAHVLDAGCGAGVPIATHLESLLNP